MLIMQILSFLLLIFLVTTSLEGVDKPVVGAYFDKRTTVWPTKEAVNGFSLEKIPPTLLTDLYYAYISYGETSKFNPALQFIATQEDKVLFDDLDELQRKSGALNLFISIGGEEFNDPKSIDATRTHRLFSEMAASSQLRAHFIDGIISFAYQYGFNGIDIDWEFPGDLTRGGRANDMDNFLKLLKEFSIRFETTQPKLLLSAAFAATVPEGISKQFQEDPKAYFTWVAECAKYLDRVHLIAYNFHTPFDIPKITGVNAPLNRDFDPYSSLFIAQSLANYLNNGVPRAKILLEIPLFGNTYSSVSDLSATSHSPGKPFQGGSLPGIMSITTGRLPYFRIADLIAAGTLTLANEPVTNTAIAYSADKKDWISFDTPETLKQKAELAARYGLKGILFWSIDRDAYRATPPFPGITAGKAGLSAAEPPKEPSIKS
jgi:chitinase